MAINVCWLYTLRTKWNHPNSKTLLDTNF